MLCLFCYIGLYCLCVHGVIAWETEWRSVNRKLVENVLTDCACFIVASCVLPLALHCFFSTLVCVLASVKP